MCKKAFDIKNLYRENPDLFCAPGQKRSLKWWSAARLCPFKKPFLSFSPLPGNHLTNQSTTRNFDARWIYGGNLTVNGGM